MIETVTFLALVLVVMVAGIRVGMLVAPRITRWADRADEDPNDR